MMAGPFSGMWAPVDPALVISLTRMPAAVFGALAASSAAFWSASYCALKATLRRSNSIALAAGELDGHRLCRPPRQMAGTSYWYTHTDQWRYDGYRADALASPLGRGRFRGKHTMDVLTSAVAMGWTPFYPQFDRSSLMSPTRPAPPAKRSPATSPNSWPRAS